MFENLVNFEKSKSKKMSDEPKKSHDKPEKGQFTVGGR
jgi:hypothetical protein